MSMVDFKLDYFISICALPLICVHKITRLELELFVCFEAVRKTHTPHNLELLYISV